VESRRWHLLWLVFQQWYLVDAAAHVLLVLDGGGWHRAKQVVVPEGIHLEFLPPYSPELQPAGRLWKLSDEPLVNRKFATLDALEDTLATHCYFTIRIPYYSKEFIDQFYLRYTVPRLIPFTCPLRIMFIASIPLNVLLAVLNDPNPIIGFTMRFTFRWSCSMMLFKYLLCRN
jgi:hypothetical protein